MSGLISSQCVIIADNDTPVRKKYDKAVIIKAFHSNHSTFSETALCYSFAFTQKCCIVAKPGNINHTNLCALPHFQFEWYHA